MTRISLATATPATFCSADYRRELEDQVLPAGTQIRLDETCPVSGTRTFQARSGRGKPWYCYRVRGASGDFAV